MFFGKKWNVMTLSTRELFDYVTDITITDGNEDSYLDKVK